MQEEPEVKTKVQTTVEELNELGFKAAAIATCEAATMARKLALAYELYRYVKPEVIQAFESKLNHSTQKQVGGRFTYDTLKFTQVKDYPHVPPQDVLASLREAQKHNIFDAFSIASIESVEHIPDPILFGRITGCDDLFYIAQWGDDVKISDLLGANDG